MTSHFMEYCRSTSLHGLKYLGERHRPMGERLCWVVAFFLSIGICFILIQNLWHKWDTSPVIVSFSEKTTPIWQIPFPAVTICSETKSRQTVFNFTRAMYENDEGNITDADLKMMESVALACDEHIYQAGNQTVGEDAIDILKNVSQPFDEMLWIVRWGNISNTPRDLFVPILTEEGLCYTFNMLDKSEFFTDEIAKDMSFLNHGKKSLWNVVDGYTKSAPVDTFPSRALGSGQNAGFSIILRSYTDDLDYLCRGPVQGFKILLHNPAETPRVSDHYFRAPLNQEMVVGVKPVMMTTSRGLEHYSPKRRQCYFPADRQLRFFRVYTQNNCHLECVTNATLDKCGCVAFYMPRPPNTAICGTGSRECQTNTRDELLMDEVKAGLRDLQGTSWPNFTHKDCYCLPACTDLQYDAVTSQADFNWRLVFQAFGENGSEFPKGLNLARVNILFKEMQFITSRRSELYGRTDFLANCGGLLGLFMGFSILSLVEIVYFCSLRILCNIFKRKVQ